MTSGFEAAGDVATGGIIASAVEAGHGGAGGAAHGSCLNCGTALIGSYCHACGQNSHLHRTIAGFLHDLLHGVFHFEGKVWGSLPMLLFRPGELTRRYIAGERAKFVSPLAMFLFCVFLTFAVIGGLAGEMHAPEIKASDRTKSLTQVRTSLARNERMMTTLKAQIREQAKAGRNTDALEARVDDLESDNDSLELAQNFLTGGREGEKYTVIGLQTGWPLLDRGLANANANPNLFLYRLQTSAYKYSWALIPLSTPLVWLLFFWKRQYKVYDHLIFVTFSISFMLLLISVLVVAGAIGLPSGVIVITALIVPPLHMYRQLRGAYLSSRLGALVRTALLVMMGMVALVLYLVLLLVLGVLH